MDRESSGARTRNVEQQLFLLMRLQRMQKNNEPTPMRKISDWTPLLRMHSKEVHDARMLGSPTCSSTVCLSVLRLCRGALLCVRLRSVGVPPRSIRAGKRGTLTRIFCTAGTQLKRLTGEGSTDA